MSSAVPVSPKSSAKRAAVASLVGTTLEWYDFTLFTLYSALIFPQLFFVGVSPQVAMIQSLGVFAVGFLARPVGALFFGRMGDKYGRKKVLVSTLLVMGGATTCIGLLPTYAQFGVLAPILLLVLRLAQGFAAGAELGSAITVAAEFSSRKRRGLWASFPAMGNFAGLILSAVAFRLVNQLPEEQLYSWGWRVPFLAGFVVVVVGIIVRLGLGETPAYLAKQAEGTVQHATLGVIIKSAWKPMVVLGVIYFACNGLSYFFQALGAAYASSFLELTGAKVANGVLIGSIGGFFTVPLFGLLSDRIGRRPIIIIGMLFGIVAAAMLFFVLEKGSASGYIVVMFIALALANAGYNAGVNSFGSELFSTEARLTGMTVSREVAGSLGGGLVPLIGASLMGLAGGPQYALMGLSVALAFIGIVTALIVRETRGISLDEPDFSLNAHPVADTVHPRQPVIATTK
ncbi:MAG: MFS transporter [Proteobacteria bacterium]|nr:MFS transporter [Pseudomonadota bacterium]